jgi:hypothetical protein
MALVKVFEQCANVIRLDSAFESLGAIDGNDRDTVTVALENRWITPDIHLVEREMVIGGKVFQALPCIIAQVTASLRIQHYNGFHVRLFQAAYRSDSGMAHSGG